MNPRLRWFIGRRRELLLVLVAVALTAGLSEAYLRAVAIDETTCFQYDPDLGWDNKPACTGRFIGPEFETAVITNQQRMRESEEFLPAGTAVRLAVMGDSFVWGHGVNETDRFTERLQALLGPGYEVMNFGVGGFGSGQHLLKIKRDILGFRPAILIVVFFINDLNDVATGANFLGVPKPRFLISPSGLTLTGVPVPRVDGWDARRNPFGLRLWTLLKDVLQEDSALGDPDATDFFNPEHITLLSRANHEVLAKRVTLNEHIYEEIHRTAHGAGISLVVTEVPYKEYFIPDALLQKRFGLQRTDLSFDRSQESLQGLSDRLGLVYLNPYDYFAAQGGLQNFFVRDQHLNPSGHRNMATVLHEGLRRHLVLQR